jgi:hypothetical protein
MPTNRHTVRRPHRAQRGPSFTSEILALFAELEAMRSQDSQKFKDGSEQLARLLGLHDEWFFCRAHVNDRSRECPYPGPQYAAYTAWHEVRAMRMMLLTATGGVTLTRRPSISATVG